MRNRTYLALMAIASICFVSCSKEEMGSAPSVYLRSHFEQVSWDYKYLPDGTLEAVDPKLKISVNLTKESTTPVTVRLAIDPSLLDAYNIEHETDLALLPSEAAIINEITIPAGEIVTFDEVTINSEKLTPGEAYVLPIRIQTASSTAQEIAISTNTNSALIRVLPNAQINNIYSELKEVDGTKVNRQNWVATASDIYSASYESGNAIDSDLNTSWRGKANTNSTFTIDLNEVKTIKAVQLVSLYQLDYRYNPSKLSIETSVDGSTWMSYGVSPVLPNLGYYDRDTPAISTVAFIYAKPIRYIALTIEEHWYSSRGSGFTEVELIE